MKSLSELPERDKTDETQQFIGDNPVKLLVNSPTEDVLVAPEHLLPQIDSISNGNDAWLKLEQLKEAYIKGISVGTRDLYEDTSWFKDNFPQCQQDDTFFAYLPNASDTYRHGTYKTALSNYYKTKNYVTYGTLNFGGSEDIKRGILFPSDNTEQYITLNLDVLNTIKQWLIYNDMDFNNIKAIINFPNMTSVYGVSGMLYKQEKNRLVNFDLTLLCPKLAKSQLGYLSFLYWPGYNKNWHLKVFLPALNNPLYFFNNTIRNSSALPIEFSDIKYLLDNINKAPTNSIRDKDRALIKIIKSGTPSSLSISITDSSGTSLDNYSLLSDTATNSAETIAETINTDSSLNNLVTAEAFKATSGNYVLVTSKNGASITAMASSNTASFTIQLIAKEASTGGPLNIHCGVSSAYGENYTLPDGTTGWRPIDGVTTTYDTGTVNLASYINQFYIDCNFKWQIIWYPTTHK